MSYIKLNSVQAGPYTRDYNRVDFDIPEGVYDFSKSYVEIETGVVHTEVVAGSLTFNGFDGKNYVKYNNADIVENVHLDCEQLGQLENIRKVNVLKHNLKLLTVSRSENYREESYNLDTKSFRQGPSQAELPFDGQINRIGDVQSRYIPNPKMKIPLKDILPGNGNMPEFPADKTGKLRLGCELRPDFFTLLQYNPLNKINPGTLYFGVDDLAAAGPTINTTDDFASVAAFQTANPVYIGTKLSIGGANYYITDLQLVAGAAPQKVAITVNTNIPIQAAAGNATFGIDFIKLNAAVAANATDIVPSGTYDAEGIPFYVGMPIRVPNQADEPSSQKYIINIVLNNDKTLTLTVNSPIVAALDVDDAINFLPGSGVLSFNRADLVLKKLAKQKSSMNTITYYTYSTEEAPGVAATQTSYSKLYYLEPECVNVMIMFPNNNEVNSSYDSFTSYRMRINNLDITNRDIVPHDALHYDRLNMTLLNGGMKLSNLLEYNNSTGQNNDPNSIDINFKPLMLMATPTPITQQDKQLQLNFIKNNTDAVPNIILFKQLIKQVKL